MQKFRFCALITVMLSASLLLAKTPSTVHIFSSSNIMGYVKPCG